jgi:hypothetical protein
MRRSLLSVLPLFTDLRQKTPEEIPLQDQVQIRKGQNNCGTGEFATELNPYSLNFFLCCRLRRMTSMATVNL